MLEQTLAQVSTLIEEVKQDRVQLKTQSEIITLLVDAVRDSRSDLKGYREELIGLIGQLKTSLQ